MGNQELTYCAMAGMSGSDVRWESRLARQSWRARSGHANLNLEWLLLGMLNMRLAESRGHRRRIKSSFECFLQVVFSACVQVCRHRGQLVARWYKTLCAFLCL